MYGWNSICQVHKTHNASRDDLVQQECLDHAQERFLVLGVPNRGSQVRTVGRLKNCGIGRRLKMKHGNCVHLGRPNQTLGKKVLRKYLTPYKIAFISSSYSTVIGEHFTTLFSD